MGIIKGAYLRKMIGYVQSGNMSFSRMVELLNHEVYKQREPLTKENLILNLEIFVSQNESDIKSKSILRINELINVLKQEL